jgi:hypothetical protein
MLLTETLVVELVKDFYKYFLSASTYSILFKIWREYFGSSDIPYMGFQRPHPAFKIEHCISVVNDSATMKISSIEFKNLNVAAFHARVL